MPIVENSIYALLFSTHQAGFHYNNRMNHTIHTRYYEEDIPEQSNINLNNQNAVSYN